jgi:hypothetical protein
METSTVGPDLRTAPKAQGGRAMRTGLTLLVLIAVLIGSWAVLIAGVVLLFRAIT